MPKFFAVGIVLFLLLGAGYGAIQAARSIPWDCADWQAFVHDDRTTSILESLAENRGKTLYCGIDQSDTFAKAETWEAGKDRNERDDTVYYGERGHFRGFIAAQEGWLTEGESGITGQSTASIFEFPKEERQRRRVKYAYLRDLLEDDGEIWMWGLPGPRVRHAQQSQANTDARAAYPADPPAAEILPRVRSVDPLTIQRNAMTDKHYDLNGTYAGVDAFCQALGYERAVNVDWYLLPRDNAFWLRLTGTRANPGPPPSGDYIRWGERTIRFRSMDCRRER